MTESLTLFSDGLLSKWGFNDGDMPDAFLDWLDDQHPDVDYSRIDWHATLRLLVRRRLLPALEQDVGVTEIGTSHNPIRATVIDGVDVEHLWYEPRTRALLSPDSVSVPFVEVLDSCVWRTV